MAVIVVTEKVETFLAVRIPRSGLVSGRALARLGIPVETVKMQWGDHETRLEEGGYRVFSEKDGEYRLYRGIDEMREAFDFDQDHYVWYGGYPGGAVLSDQENRWKQYIRESLIETSISKDILMLNRVDKPALMKRLFELGCNFSGQILSYNKIMGQLTDAGNTTTLAHYLHLLDTAGLLKGIEKAGTTDVDAVIKAMEGMVICDNLRLAPTYIRSWDHQFLGAYPFVRDLQVEGVDIFEILFTYNSKDYARGLSENPLDLTAE